jgi:hypothetical protein
MSWTWRAEIRTPAGMFNLFFFSAAASMIVSCNRAIFKLWSDVWYQLHHFYSF